MHHAVVDYVSGVIAGSAAILTGYPFDTVKVRLQSLKGASYRGPLHCALHILRHEGISSLFRGVASPLVGGALETGLNYMLYERTYAFLTDRDPRLAQYSATYYLAGSTAGLGIAFVLSPIELVKCRMQVDAHGKHSSSLACLKDVIFRDGFRGLTRGLTATQLREIAGNGMFFWSYFAIKKQLSLRTSPESQTAASRVLCSILSGGVAGILAWTVMLPADNVKTNMQVKAGKFDSFLLAARHIYRRRGVRGFYVGLGTTLARAFPANACQWLVYELSSTKLRQLSTLQLSDETSL
mmetsp:Transcript_3612/g.10852  ORF Transcript_3612/g.10852 Transcript_3612/m.10852 type:complete len:296 (-) Transcript_3612:67-954(-)